MRFAGLVCLFLTWFNTAPGEEEALPDREAAAPRQAVPYGISQEHVLSPGAPAPAPVLPYRISTPIPTPDSPVSSVAQPSPSAVPVPRPIPPHAASQGRGFIYGAPAPTPVPPYCSPAPIPTAAAQNVPGPDGVTARLEHLLEAAVHLETAGESQEAQKIRQLVARERQTLQDRLAGRKTPSADRQVKVDLRVIELSRSRLAELGFDFAVVQGDRIIKPLSPQQFSVIDDNASLLAMLEALRKEGLVRVLAEPTLVGVSGRPVSFQCGGQVAAVPGGGLGQPVDPQGSVFVGTQVDLVPAVTEPDQIRLDMKVTITEPVDARSTESGKQLPKVRTRRLNTGTEMKSGQTCILGGLLQNTGKPDNETVETLVLITSEIVGAPLTARAP